MFEALKKKYVSKYIRKDQLKRFVTLGYITEDEYFEIIKG